MSDEQGQLGSRSQAMDSHSGLALTAIAGADLAENLASSSSGSMKTDQGSPVDLEGSRQYDKDLVHHLHYSLLSMKNPDTLQHFPDIIPDEIIDSIQEEEEPVNVRIAGVNDAGPLPGNIASPEGNQTLRATIQAEPNILSAPPLPWCDLVPEKVTQVLSRRKNPEGGDVEILMVIPPLKSSGEETTKEEVFISFGEGTKEEVMKSLGEETMKEEAFKSLGEKTTKEELMKSLVEETMKEEVLKLSGGETTKEEAFKSLSEKTSKEEVMKSSGEETMKEEAFKSLGEKTTKEELMKSLVEETMKEEVLKLSGGETTKEEAFKSLSEKTSKEEVMKSSGEETMKEEVLKLSVGETTKEEAFKSLDEETMKEEVMKSSGEETTIEEVMKSSGEETKKEEVMKSLGEETSKEEIVKSSREETTKNKVLKSLGEEETKEEVMKSSGEETKKKEVMKSSGEEMTKEEVMKSLGEEMTKEEVMKSSGEEMTKEEVLVKGAVEEQVSTNEGKKDEIKEQKNEMKRKTLTLPQEERELYRKVRSILYKLSPQKFHTSIKQVQGLVIDTETKLKGFTDIIFEKAISEPAYSVAYANFCRYLLTLKVPLNTKPGESINFRVLLLTRCQREFEKDLDRRKKDIEDATDNKKVELKKELVAAVRNERWRSIGNIRFIGELFKLKMLTEAIMHDCVLKLLRSGDEVHLECLCHLLTTIGKELESEKAKSRMDQYFNQMEKLVAEKKISHRCHSMLQDVIDLRNNSWKPHREENNPKTIDQIHKDAKREAVEQNMPTALHMAQRRSQRMRHQSRTARGRPCGQTGGSMEATRDIDRTIDVSKPVTENGTLKNADKNIDMTFRGSGDGSRASQEGGMSKATVNRFSALSKEDDQRSRAFGRGVNLARGEGRMRCHQPGEGFNRGKLFTRSSQEQERERTLASARNLMSGDRTTLPFSTNSPEVRKNPGEATQAIEQPLAAAPLPWCDLDPEKVTQVLSRLKNPEGGGVEILMVIPPSNSLGEETKKEEVMKSSGEETTKEEVLVNGTVEEQGSTNEGKKDEIKEQKNETTRKTLTLPQDERELYRKVRSILNKLTPQKFKTLITQVQGLVIDTETKLKGVTSLLWEQATRDTAYAKEYASLCTHLMQVEVPFEQIEGEHLRFRTALLNLCRKGFTEIMNYAQNINGEKDSSEEGHDNNKYRRKYVGVVRFMGELFQHQMLLEKIIIDCLSKLLQSGNEILLECFCQLMFVVGETLHQRNKADDYFQQIQEIIREKNVSTKCCFLLQDVIDLRDNEWKPLRHQYTPVTIDEIHEQVNLEEVRQMKWEVNQVPMWRPVIVIEPPPTRVPLSGQPCPLPDSSTFARDLTKLQNHDCRIYESPTAWSRGTPRLEFGEPEEELYPKVRGILNKLTPQKFQTLIKQFQGLVIDTETKLKGVTDVIFEKAISEPAFSVAYANMCRYLLNLKVPSDTKPGESVNFRVIMLTRCQREFEKEKDTQLDIDRRKKDIEEATDQKKATKMKGEIDQAITNARRRSIGNIRFIGELFKLKMLTETIMHDCVYKLLRSRDEENLECACRLLTTIGKELESEKANPRMDQYFQQMMKIVAEKKVSSRCRFKLQDVIDLRDNSWTPRPEENNPKTIDQIHKDAKREAVEQNMLTVLHMAQRPSKIIHYQSRTAQGSPSGHTRGSIEYIKAIRDRTIDINNADKNIEFKFRGGFGRGDGSRVSQEGLMSKAPGKRLSALDKEDDQRSRVFGGGVSLAGGEGRTHGNQPGEDLKVTPRSSQEQELE